MIPVISAVAGAGFAIWRSRIDAEVRALRELLSADVLDAAHAKRAASIIAASERIAGGVRSVTGRWGNAASYEILCTLCRAPGAAGSAKLLRLRGGRVSRFLCGDRLDPGETQVPVRRLAVPIKTGDTQGL